MSCGYRRAVNPEYKIVLERKKTAHKTRATLCVEHEDFDLARLRSKDSFYNDKAKQEMPIQVNTCNSKTIVIICVRQLLLK